MDANLLQPRDREDPPSGTASRYAVSRGKRLVTKVKGYFPLVLHCAATPWHDSVFYCRLAASAAHGTRTVGWGVLRKRTARRKCNWVYCALQDGSDGTSQPTGHRRIPSSGAPGVLRLVQRVDPRGKCRAVFAQLSRQPDAVPRVNSHIRYTGRIPDRVSPPTAVAPF